ncbi:MAG: MATE family efflux transporter, partial [Oscillospiraceae bacterium]|nr:MATE family efflux transporter [Oscillospiraceae bacterium]
MCSLYFEESITVLKKLVGDRAFYRRLMAVMLPILIQNVITNFVGLLDNIMVGQVGTEPMSGVAIVNQLLFVFNLSIFGGLAGAGIFTAQYYGKSDNEGVRHTFRAKLYLSAALVFIAFTVFLTMGDRLIELFLHEGEENLDLGATLAYGRDYLKVMLWQIPLFAIMQVYGSTLRETGETVLPMKAGVTAVFVNLVFNYILIFGKLGAPAMGVVGAAVATVISRVVECGIIVIWTHRHKSKALFIEGAYNSGYVPLSLVHQIAVRGLPLLVNEILWASGMTMLNQCYSTRGLEVVSAVNIATTVSNLFFCAFFAMGST